MQMTPEQLVEEYRDTVLELHLTRRHVSALETENASLRAQLAPAEEQGHSHSHGEDGGHSHND
ncbi:MULTISPECIES: hypothetical protein [Streptomyces]|nr:MULTISPECIES: hypothetical protein [Streptomyces]MYT01084.1 hypothetical protein [Streptomyces sp. SID5469]OOV31058.1 hypothetical protein SM007_15965 [Streptomyces avermitilis]BBJ53655.1 hypothetical protein SAVMC3_62840 [Streptomyces avermitilis]GDY65660.1 hypothetical protein SAV14893_050530 [Streptomyces avermitilis]GDY74122.1 hypothetical protein SAV31267_036070 [Streptomyces avermitilis]